MSGNRWVLLLTGALVIAIGLGFDAKPIPAAPGMLPNGEIPASTPPGDIGVASRPVSVRYTFDDGIHRPIADVAGRYELRALGHNGGALRLVRKGHGFALGFPNRCRMARARDCPTAILQGVRDDSLNPGRRPLRYGASIRMTHADLADGANVLQKGYSVGEMGQFKLQVDHSMGHPSCVLADDGRRYRAEPWVDVADGRWHDLACERTNERLAMSVDGVEKAWVAVPPRLSIASAEPLRVGGKSAGDRDDQFAGEIDNVFLDIGG